MTMPTAAPPDALVPGLATRRARAHLVERIDEAIAAWREFHDDPEAEPGLIETDLVRLRESARRDQVTAGLFGLIKRGKSTLLNALVGEAVSPASPTPETAVPVHVEFGESTAIEAWHADGYVQPLEPEQLRDHTSQKGANKSSGTTHVRYRLPSPLLVEGLKLIDTPGLDDAQADELFVQRTTQELAAVDLGIVTFLSPPTVGAVEMEFLREVVACGPDRVIVVANLYPQHFHDPEKREAVCEYVRTRVGEAAGDTPLQLIAVCAEEAWQARVGGDDDAFAAAGGQALVEAICRVVDEAVGRPALARLEAELASLLDRGAGEVDLRLGLLASEEAIAARRDEVAAHLEALEEDLERPIDAAVRELHGLAEQSRSVLQQLHFTTKGQLAEAHSTEQVDRIVAQATRAIEVRAEETFRLAQTRISRTLAELDQALDARADATLVDLGGSRRVVRQPGGSGGWSAPAATLGSAAVGGLVGAGAGMVLVGAALGPIGLVGGALLAWRMGELRRSRRDLAALKEATAEQLGEVVTDLIGRLDQRIDLMVEEARTSARRRRTAFTSDLRDTLETMDALAADPVYRAEALVRAMHVGSVFGQLAEEVDAGSGGVAHTIAVDDPAHLQAVEA
jgi:hypothetical protein